MARPAPLHAIQLCYFISTSWDFRSVWQRPFLSLRADKVSSSRWGNRPAIGLAIGPGHCGRPRLNAVIRQGLKQLVKRFEDKQHGLNFVDLECLIHDAIKRKGP